MVKESVTKALADANVRYEDVKQAVVGYVYGLYRYNWSIYLPNFGKY